MSKIKFSLEALISSNKYRSCLLTTFSFDQTFFEMHTLKMLRSKGVSNVNVLVDGRMYDALLNSTTNLHQKHNGYTLIPIYQQRSFHPKIWILIGRNDALLIIGSGNLTGSGMGGNDEIWSAFHISVHNLKFKSLLIKAYQYVLQHLDKDIPELWERVTSWIAVNTNKELLSNPESIELDDFQLLVKDGQGTIWSSIEKLIPSDLPKKITLGSPYFEENGHALQRIREVYSNAEIHVILEENGILPIKLQNPKQYHFYNWNTINQEKQKNLHAKFIHFHCTNGTEYLLTGSSNITSAGLGVHQKFNSEVSILQRGKSARYLQNLGIDVKISAAKDLSQFEANNDYTNSSTPIDDSRNYKIRYAIITQGKLKIYLNDTINTVSHIHLLRSDQSLIQEFRLSSISLIEFLDGLSYEKNQSIYVVINDSDGTRISNIQPVHFQSALSKTYPSENQANIEKALFEFEQDEYEILHRYAFEIYKDDIIQNDNTRVQASGSEQSNENLNTDDDNIHVLDDYRDVKDSQIITELYQSNSWPYRFYMKLLEDDELFVLDKPDDIDEEEQKPSVDSDEHNDDDDTIDDKLNSKDKPDSNHVDEESLKIKRLSQFKSIIKKAKNKFDEKIEEGTDFNRNDLFRFFFTLEIIKRHVNKRIKGYKVLFDDCYIYPFNKTKDVLSLDELCINYVIPFLKQIALNQVLQDTFREWEKDKTREVVLILYLLLLTHWSNADIKTFKLSVLLTIKNLGINSRNDWESILQKLEEAMENLDENGRDYKVFKNNIEFLKLSKQIRKAFSS